VKLFGQLQQMLPILAYRLFLEQIQAHHLRLMFSQFCHQLEAQPQMHKLFRLLSLA
jgi:hypothetical protein